MYQLNNNSQYKGRDFFNFDTTSRLPRHRWYYLKEGFSAALVEEAINAKLNECNRRLSILEPFCGTGTNPLTSALNHHRCTAIEVNPFLAFTARVKTSTEQWNDSEFRSHVDHMIQLSASGAYSPLENCSTFTERDSLSKWLFNKSVIRRFTSLLNSIREADCKYKEHLELAAVVAAYNCCNAKRDGKALRYKTDWKKIKYSDEDFIEQFRLQAQLISRDTVTHPIDQEFKSLIINGDSREVLPTLEESQFDLVVTSPPYLNSFDYSDIYRPELFLGGYVQNNNELKQIRLQTLRSHVQVKWPQDVSFESSLLSPVIMNLNQVEDLWNKNIPLMVKAYFDDLYKVFFALRAKMRLGGMMWFVISTSCFGGVHIPVDLIAADAGSQAGFSLQGIFCLRELRAAGQQWKHFKTKELPLRESLIIMRK